MLLPRIICTCCGITYDSYNHSDAEYFSGFKHKSDSDEYAYGITVRLVCKNNNCITSFTFYFDSQNEIIKTKKTKGSKLLHKLQKLYLEPVELEKEEDKFKKESKHDDWVYVAGYKNGRGAAVYKYKNNKKINTEYSIVKESNVYNRQDSETL